MAKAHLITREGWFKLDEELKYLWKTRRPEVTQAVSEAAALGDRSENAEYKEGKRLLRSIDRRIRFLSKRLDELTIVDYSPVQDNKVFFGAYVELERAEMPPLESINPDDLDPQAARFFEEYEETHHKKESAPSTTASQTFSSTGALIEQPTIGSVVHYRIVGSDEIEPDGLQISIDAPMARALIGKRVDDDVYVKTPSGFQCWYINAIQYQPF